MTNEQLLAIGIPLLVNGFMFATIQVQLHALNKRIDELKDLWRAELRRVEEVLDARLKHLEEK